MPTITKAVAGVYEGLVRLRPARAAADEMLGLPAGSAGGLIFMAPTHPFNETAPMAGTSPQHIFNTSGNPGMSTSHPFSVLSPPRDWSRRVHQRSSRVTYTRL